MKKNEENETVVMLTDHLTAPETETGFWQTAPAGRTYESRGFKEAVYLTFARLWKPENLHNSGFKK